MFLTSIILPLFLIRSRLSLEVSAVIAILLLLCSEVVTSVKTEKKTDAWHVDRPKRNDFTCKLCSMRTTNPCFMNDELSLDARCTGKEKFCLTLVSEDASGSYVLFKGCDRLNNCSNPGVTWYNKTVQKICCQNSSPDTPCNLRNTLPRKASTVPNLTTSRLYQKSAFSLAVAFSLQRLFVLR
ncbi:uncharacterized protein LOC134846155 isoform X1 [Symsagittifera roscoffensis]|uniref:uncharacterized protein LOC134846155 isoform X1 n=1 Tax=Symsagittifera roscoffensis TaxID=84072 RepID=UPI00307B295B